MEAELRAWPSLLASASQRSSLNSEVKDAQGLPEQLNLFSPSFSDGTGTPGHILHEIQNSMTAGLLAYRNVILGGGGGEGIKPFSEVLPPSWDPGHLVFAVEES